MAGTFVQDCSLPRVVRKNCAVALALSRLLEGGRNWGINVFICGYHMLFVAPDDPLLPGT